MKTYAISGATQNFYDLLVAFRNISKNIPEDALFADGRLLVPDLLSEIEILSDEHGVGIDVWENGEDYDDGCESDYQIVIQEKILTHVLHSMP